MLSPLTITSNQIELTNFKLNKAGYVITLCLMYFSALLPMIIITLILAGGGKLTFGFLIITAVFCFIVYFFYRLATWNKHGKEKYILENGVFIYQPEAKNISYKKLEFNPDHLVVSIIDSEIPVEYDGMKQTIAWLKLNDGQTILQTNIKTPRSLILDMTNTFEDWGFKVEGNFEKLHESSE